VGYLRPITPGVDRYPIVKAAFFGEQFSFMV